eukprot:5487026-Lingulodinium_polyedra.AAC.1
MRRAVPPWRAPVELWRTVFDPAGGPRTGCAAGAQRLRAPMGAEGLQRVLFGILYKTGRAGWAP